MIYCKCKLFTTYARSTLPYENLMLLHYELVELAV